MKLKTLMPFVLLLILLASVFFTYSDVYNFAFLYDDDILIVNNIFLRSFDATRKIFTSSTSAGAGMGDAFYRPIQIFIYLLVYQGFGLETWSFHLLNIILHACNVILIFLLGRRLGLLRPYAFFAALIWAVHPMHIEAVTYVSATADALHTLFILLALILIHIDFKVKRWPVSIIAALFLFVAALMTKESSVIFPALLMVFLFFSSSRRLDWKAYLTTIPFWCIAIIYMGLRSMYIHPASNIGVFKDAPIHASNFFYRLETFFATLPSYAELIFWPNHLGYERAFPVYTSFFELPVIIGLVLFLLPFVFLVFALKNKSHDKPWAVWASLSFFVALLPTSSLIAEVNSLFLEHWMYLPSIFLFLALAHQAQKLLQYRNFNFKLAAVGFCICAVTALAIKTKNQNWVWYDAQTLYTNILSYNPDIYRVRHNLAMIYDANGDTDGAIREYEYILEHTQLYPQTYYNLGLMYWKKNQLDKAENFLLQAIENSPGFIFPYWKLHEFYELKGDKEKSKIYKERFEELYRAVH